jgi:DNA-binding transcriptional MerR regulator
MPEQSFMSIGEVLARLRSDFPDITISKIRFLESEGLIEPERSASGYRKFSPDDVERLRYVLTAQRDQYLPLRVIRENLETIAAGGEPVQSPAAGPPRPAAEPLPGPELFANKPGEPRLSREQLLAAAGITAAQLEALEAFGLLRPRSGDTFDGDALVIARTVGELSAFGLEPRHLRSFKAAAEREVGLIEQLVLPMLRQRNPQARTRAEQLARQLATLSVRLHAFLVKAALPPEISR